MNPLFGLSEAVLAGGQGRTTGIPSTSLDQLGLKYQNTPLPPVANTPPPPSPGGAPRRGGPPPPGPPASGREAGAGKPGLRSNPDAPTSTIR
jgi:hypothetical protein